MRYLKSINENFDGEIDYLTSLKQQKEIGNNHAKSVDAKHQRVTKEITGKHLPNIQSNNQKDRNFDEMVRERTELVDTVVHALIQGDLKRNGFDNFKSDLKQLLEKYSLDKLPKRGHGVVSPGHNV